MVYTVLVSLVAVIFGCLIGDFQTNIIIIWALGTLSGFALDIYFYNLDMHPLLIFFYMMNANIE